MTFFHLLLSSFILLDTVHVFQFISYLYSLLSPQFNSYLGIVLLKLFYIAPYPLILCTIVMRFMPFKSFQVFLSFLSFLPFDLFLLCLSISISILSLLFYLFSFLSILSFIFPLFSILVWLFLHPIIIYIILRSHLLSSTLSVPLYVLLTLHLTLPPSYPTPLPHFYPPFLPPSMLGLVSYIEEDNGKLRRVGGFTHLNLFHFLGKMLGKALYEVRTCERSHHTPHCLFIYIHSLPELSTNLSLHLI